MIPWSIMILCSTTTSVFLILMESVMLQISDIGYGETLILAKLQKTNTCKLEFQTPISGFRETLILPNSNMPIHADWSSNLQIQLCVIVLYQYFVFFCPQIQEQQPVENVLCELEGDIKYVDCSKNTMTHMDMDICRQPNS